MVHETLQKGTHSKLPGYLLIGAALLLTLPFCRQRSNGNQRNGVQDALDNRPDEGIRDAGEEIQESTEDAGRGNKDTVNNN